MYTILVDLAAVLIIILLTWLGAKRGFIKTLASAISVFLASVASRFISSLVAPLFPEGSSFLIVFIISFIVVGSLLSFVAKILNLAAKLPIISTVNKILGLVCGVILGALAVTVIGFILYNSNVFADNSVLTDSIIFSTMMKLTASAIF